MKLDRIITLLILGLFLFGCKSHDEQTTFIAVSQKKGLIFKNYQIPIQIPFKSEFGWRKMWLPKNIKVSNQNENLLKEKIKLEDNIASFFRERYFETIKELNIENDNYWLSFYKSNETYNFYACGKITFDEDTEGLLVLMESAANEKDKQLILFTVHSDKLQSFVVLSAVKSNVSTEFLYDQTYDVMYLIRSVKTNVDNIFPQNLITEYHIDALPIKMYFTYFFEINKDGIIKEPNYKKWSRLESRLPKIIIKPGMTSE